MGQTYALNSVYRQTAFDFRIGRVGSEQFSTPVSIQFFKIKKSPQRNSEDNQTTNWYHRGQIPLKF